jgi:hypothetical protein
MPVQRSGGSSLRVGSGVEGAAGAAGAAGLGAVATGEIGRAHV